MLLSYSLVAFGSPMPPRITWLEIVMGGGLLIGGIMLAGGVVRQAREDAMSRWVLILAFVLLVVPTCTGLMHGNAWGNMVRDIAPIAFIISIPILLIHATTIFNRATLSMLMTALVLFVGVVTAIIFFVSVIQTYGSIDNLVAGATKYIQSTPSTSTTQAEFYVRELFLKPYDPAMLFAALFTSAWGLVLVAKFPRAWLLGWILIGFGALIAYAFMALGLRAYTAVYTLSMGLICLTLYKEWGLYVKFLPLVVAGIAFYSTQIEAVLHLLLYKQQTIGFNGKASEWQQVIDAISGSHEAVLFGTGWGGVLKNPIYEGGETRFTHSIISFFLLKSGLIGLGAVFVAMATLLGKMMRSNFGSRIAYPELILVISCLPPLAIGVLFQPTYKTLSFGIILTLSILVVPAIRVRGSHGGQCKLGVQ